MSQELLNTSAPRGVKPGSTGFCTVGITAGMSPVVEERLTLLSGYRWLVPPGEGNADKNPVAWAHWRLGVSGRTLSVLSRVCDAGFDYSRRSNRLAHHVILDPSEQAPAGPAWLMNMPGLMRDRWTGEPQVFAAGPDIPQADSGARVCKAWESATGDAGWAGVLAEAFAQDPARVAYIVYAPGVQMLPLIDEALALLPPAVRWQVTFSTYFTDLPAGMACAWRCCVAGTHAATEAHRNAASCLVIYLTRPLSAAPDGPYVRAARTGMPVEAEPMHAPTAHASAAQRYDWQAQTDEDSESALAAVAMARAAAAAENSADAAAAESEAFWGTDTTSPVASRRRPKASSRRGTPAAFWAVALLWPAAVAGGVLWYLRHSEPAPRTVAQPTPAIATTLPAATEPAPPEGAVDSVASQQAAVQKLHDAEQTLQRQNQTVTNLRQELTKAQTALVAATKNASAGGAAAIELAKLKADYAAVQKKLNDALAASPATAPTPAAATDERAVEVLRDEVELWAADGNGPPDTLRLDASPIPESLVVERTPVRIVFKTVGLGGAARATPAELGLIRVDGGRVVLEWVGQGRQQLAGMSAARAWLQLARLQVLRKGETVGSVRFLPLKNFTLNVEREAPVSLLPDVHWKPALQRVGLAPPAAAPEGWTVRQKDDQTLTVAQAKAGGAAFDVQIVLTTAGELRPQTSWALALAHQSAAAEEQAAVVTARKTVVERIGARIEELIDPATSKAKDPASQKDLDAARAESNAAAAALSEALAAKQAAQDAAAALRAMPALTIPVINRDSGTVLCTLRVKRGEKGKE
ncbi:MAG: hypothetical protein JWO87_2344 [Phycisphaerales bacterium]|nr:hypothetical protein [Phycisphaerales bacterium]